MQLIYTGNCNWVINSLQHKFQQKTMIQWSNSTVIESIGLLNYFSSLITKRLIFFSEKIQIDSI